MTKRDETLRWRVDVFDKPHGLHVADAVEIVAGEIVRRVTLLKEDYDILNCRNLWRASHEGNEPTAQDLSVHVKKPLEDVVIILRRLTASGIIPTLDKGTLQ